jgi:hypothetical protein
MEKQAAIKLGGAKRKNGHKMNCHCHICENMKNKAKRGGYQADLEKEQLQMMGGSKKKNGHKPNCSCPICKNMRNVKKSGKTMKAGKKSNGHKMNCKCPICKNMSKKSRKGGAEIEASDNDYDDDDLDNIPDALDNDESKKMTNNANTATNNDNNYNDDNDDAPITRATANANQITNDGNDEDISDLSSSAYQQNTTGGRKRKTLRKRKSNGHKANCNCPICKNMRKRKGGAVVPSSSVTETTQTTANIPEADNEVDADVPIARATGNDNRLASMTATPDEIDELSFTPNVSGGRIRKSLRKRNNGHKTNCMCPICKNMRKGKGKTKRR